VGDVGSEKLFSLCLRPRKGTNYGFGWKRRIFHPIGCPGFFSNKELKIKTALILIDIQNDYFPSGPLELKGITEATEKAANLLGLFRVNR
ncbi:MAG: hypothetical protein QGE94_00340, partial [Desulfobacterales bacterium]|nr:hypothetical protein [Desulfobacterales bacterium]